ncbi:MAG: hypothetical protein JRD89_21120 [Deltaproteobacteria bacterium]|nr:hypothetical protein [Deltaproteobacteria bacterium]
MIAAGGAATADEAARLLMEEAARTSRDNITLIVIRVHSEAIRDTPGTE